jgi:hypothetical protein
MPALKENNLATLPRGLLTLDGIQFDIRGLVQLSCTHRDLGYLTRKLQAYRSVRHSARFISSTPLVGQTRSVGKLENTLLPMRMASNDPFPCSMQKIFMVGGARLPNQNFSTWHHFGLEGTQSIERSIQHGSAALSFSLRKSAPKSDHREHHLPFGNDAMCALLDRYYGGVANQDRLDRSRCITACGWH